MEPVQADAQSVVDWYRERLAEVTHRAAFAECALSARSREVWELRGDLTALRGELNELLGSVRAGGQAQGPGPEHPDFPGWVSEHWDAIQDAHLAGMLERAEQPAPVEQS